MSFSHSEKFENLPKALVALQAALPNPKRDGVNDFFKKNGKGSKFLSLDELALAVKPVLKEHGFAVTQTFDGVLDDDRVYLNTTLLHESGEWISSTLAMPTTKKNDPQAVGGSITYARRYALASILGVVSDEDDDGNTAAAPPASRPATKPRPAQTPITNEQHDKIWELSKQITGSELGAQARIDEGVERLGLKSLDDMTATMANKVIASLREEVANLKKSAPANYYKD